MKKKAVWATLLILTVVSAFALVAYADPLVLRPVGRVRVSLEDYSWSGSGLARATWNPWIQVYDGSFSAELNTGTMAGTDFAAVVISPLNVPLSTLKTLGAGGIRFWVYFYDCPSTTQQLVVELVLDNGRVMEGYDSTPVLGGGIACESAAPSYPRADLWTQMKPTDQWYSSFAGTDPLIPGTWTIANPQTIATWWGTFSSARIIQMRISFWSTASTNYQAFVDNVIFCGRPIPIEPENVGLPPHAV